MQVPGKAGRRIKERVLRSNSNAYAEMIRRCMSVGGLLLGYQVSLVYFTQKIEPNKRAWTCKQPSPSSDGFLGASTVISLPGVMDPYDVSDACFILAQLAAGSWQLAVSSSCWPANSDNQHTAMLTHGASRIRIRSAEPSQGRCKTRPGGAFSRCRMRVPLPKQCGNCTAC